LAHSKVFHLQNIRVILTATLLMAVYFFYSFRIILMKFLSKIGGNFYNLSPQIRPLVDTVQCTL